VVVLVVVLVWLVALIPFVLRRHSAYRVHASVARFRRQRRLLELAYRSRRDDASEILSTSRGDVVCTNRDRPRHSSRATPSTLRLRRRRLLSIFAGALAISLILGALPELRAFWTIAIVLSVLLVAYVVLLSVFAADSSPSHQRRLPAEADLSEPEIWFNPHQDLGDVERHEARMPWVRLVVEEQSA
jgi:hypothetical protein